MREAAFEPSAAANSRRCVVELCAERVRRERHERDCCEVEIASAREKGSGDQKRLSFDNNAEEQNQVAVLEKKKFQRSNARDLYSALFYFVCFVD